MFFSNIAGKHSIQGYQPYHDHETDDDEIIGIINKFKNHPNILAIKKTRNSNDKLSLTEVDEN